MPHAQTLFGARLRHYSQEKKYMSEQFLPILLRRCRYHVKRGKNILMLIDSGTTMYHLLDLLGQETVRYHQNNDEIISKLLIATNNLPGVEILIENGRTNPNNRYSPLAVKCHLLPGTPLPVYSAILGEKTQDAIKTLRNECGKDTVVIGLVTGNWLRLRRHLPACPVPLARGEGHLEFKQTLVDNSDEIYVLSPLGKIFVDVSPDEVNKALRFNEENVDQDKKPYNELKIEGEMPHRVKLISTYRREGRLLHDLSTKIQVLLEIRQMNYDRLLDGNEVEIPHILFPYDMLPDTSYEQMLVEFPHEHTRRTNFMRDFFFARL